MAWEVRFVADPRSPQAPPQAPPRGGPSPFRAEADALTHARFLLHRVPGGRVEVIDREARRRAVYRLRGGRMVALADALQPVGPHQRAAAGGLRALGPR